MTRTGRAYDDGSGRPTTNPCNHGSLLLEEITDRTESRRLAHLASETVVAYRIRGEALGYWRVVGPLPGGLPVDVRHCY